MAAPVGRPAKTSNRGRPERPIYARTSVLCNGQIAWKVGSDQDMQPNKADDQKADLRPVIDVKDDLNALNGLQIHRARPLTPVEIKQPLRHVHSCLPTAVKTTIYTGDQYGSQNGAFSCADDAFKSKANLVFGNEVRGDGDMNYNEFFRRLHRSEWLLWDVEAEKGHWVAVIAHLYKGSMPNPEKRNQPDNPDIPATIPSLDFNRVDEWCVVSARRSPETDAMVNRVRRRFPDVLKEGRVRVDKDSEIKPALWVPMDQTTWASGIYVYAIIKALMHRLTELHCKNLPHQKGFWEPLPGWLNIDEVRAEMQGRAAQRCMAATGYRSRIAIEGVRRWIGSKEVIRAKELRPRRRDYRVYQTGKVGKDGHCIPIETLKQPTVVTTDVGTDTTAEDNTDDGSSFKPILPLKSDNRPKGSPLRKLAVDNSLEARMKEYSARLDKLMGRSPAVSDSSPGPVTPVKSGQQPSSSSKKRAAGSLLTLSPYTPRSGGDLSNDSIPPKRTPSPLAQRSMEPGSSSPETPASPPKKRARSSIKNTPVVSLQRQATTNRQRLNEDKFKGPLATPPPHVPGWNDESSDDSNLSRHEPLTKLRQEEADASPSKKPGSLYKKRLSRQGGNVAKFKGPLPTPPPRVHGWHDDSSDDSNLSRHVPLAKVEKDRQNKSAETSTQETTEEKGGVKRNAAAAGVGDDIAKVGSIGEALNKRLKTIDSEMQRYSSEELEE